MSGPKLVRDLIPDVIRANGQVPIISSVDDGEMFGLLMWKLREEVDEVDKAYTEPELLDELVDVVEVVIALAALHGCGFDDLMDRRDRKRRERGGFELNLVWHGNREASDAPA